MTAVPPANPINPATGQPWTQADVDTLRAALNAANASLGGPNVAGITGFGQGDSVFDLGGDSQIVDPAERVALGLGPIGSPGPGTPPPSTQVPLTSNGQPVTSGGRPVTVSTTADPSLATAGVLNLASGVAVDPLNVLVLPLPAGYALNPITGELAGPLTAPGGPPVTPGVPSLADLSAHVDNLETRVTRLEGSGTGNVNPAGLSTTFRRA